LHKKKLVLVLRGGLGNQLFQVTAGAHFARKFEAELVLDDSAIIRHKNKSRRSWLRKIAIDRLFIDIRIDWQNLMISQLKASHLGANRMTKKMIGENELKNLLSLSGHITVYDWFHSKDYLPLKKLHLNSDELFNLREFVMDAAISKKNDEGSAAMHIRLGDFERTSWGVLPQRWYLNAALTLANSGIITIDCFSDDIARAREIFDKIPKKIRLNFVEEKMELMPHELLYLMSQYRYFVSSNSSISWWSSYLNQRENAEIFCAWGQSLLLPSWKLIRI